MINCRTHQAQLCRRRYCHLKFPAAAFLITCPSRRCKLGILAGIPLFSSSTAREFQHRTSRDPRLSLVQRRRHLQQSPAPTYFFYHRAAATFSVPNPPAPHNPASPTTHHARIDFFSRPLLGSSQRRRRSAASLAAASCLQHRTSHQSAAHCRGLSLFCSELKRKKNKRRKGDEDPSTGLKRERIKKGENESFEKSNKEKDGPGQPSQLGRNWVGLLLFQGPSPINQGPVHLLNAPELPELHRKSCESD